jgi:hypothetical protein
MNPTVIPQGVQDEVFPQYTSVFGVDEVFANDR